jgi:hypothetical protein
MRHDTAAAKAFRAGYLLEASRVLSGRTGNADDAVLEVEVLYLRGEGALAR